MRLLGRRKTPPTSDPPRPLLRLGPGQLASLPGPVEAQVAGESFHESAIARAQRRGPQGLPLEAVLVLSRATPAILSQWRCM